MSPDAPAARDEVCRILTEINQAWLEGRPRELHPLLHESMVMPLPGFEGFIEGRETIVAGFVDFCENARVLDFQESDRRVDVFQNVAVASFAFAVVYQREGKSYRSTGRDLWVFGLADGGWRAVFRTMIDVAESPVD